MRCCSQRLAAGQKTSYSQADIVQRLPVLWIILCTFIATVSVHVPGTVFQNTKRLCNRILFALLYSYYEIYSHSSPAPTPIFSFCYDFSKENEVSRKFGKDFFQYTKQWTEILKSFNRVNTKPIAHLTVYFKARSCVPITIFDTTEIYFEETCTDSIKRCEKHPTILNFRHMSLQCSIVVIVFRLAGLHRKELHSRIVSEIDLSFCTGTWRKQNRLKTVGIYKEM